MAYIQNIHWENVIKRETKRFSETDLNEVEGKKGDHVITKAHVIVKDVFSIPRYFLEENLDTNKLLIEATKNETETLNNIEA